MNKATRINVSVLGTIFGVSGMLHGFFEVLQGDQPTPGFYINAIAPAQQMWPHGTEPALTLIPNYLYSGIAALLVGLALSIWALACLHKPHGATVLLLLFVLLLLLGGGVAQTLFFPFIWLAATRIHKPLAWWDKTLSVNVRRSLSRLWPVSLILPAALLSFALEIAVTGFVPGIHDPDQAVMVMLACLAAFLLLLPLVFISGFARDLTKKH